MRQEAEQLIFILFPAAPKVQLVGGGASYGRVEVSVDGGMYTVCDNHWSEYDATAVCKSLGFQGGDAILVINELFFS